MGGPVPRSMVGLLAAVGAAMSALVAFTHGDLAWLTIANAAVATGLAAYAAAPLSKKLLSGHPPRSAGTSAAVRAEHAEFLMLFDKSCDSGVCRASFGLAVAVAPAGR